MYKWIVVIGITMMVVPLMYNSSEVFNYYKDYIIALGAVAIVGAISAYYESKRDLKHD